MSENLFLRHQVFVWPPTTKQLWIRSLIKYVQLTMSHQQTTNLQKCVAILSKKKLNFFPAVWFCKCWHFLLLNIKSIFSFYTDFLLTMFSFNPYWHNFPNWTLGWIYHKHSSYLQRVIRRKIKKRKSNLMIIFWISLTGCF